MFTFFEKKDSQIERDIKDELNFDPSVTSTNITVSVKDGIVTLGGTVPHYSEKSSAEAVAQRIGGVRAVANEMEVDIMGSYERSDEDIAEAALNALAWSYSAPKDLKVTVEKGWITLKGQADWDYQRCAARNAVSDLFGVRGVSNNISIKSSVQASDVKAKIEESLKRIAETEGKKINVAVKGDQVTLTGNVRSFSEIEDARVAAWNAPGVMRVENNLKLAA